MTSNAWWRLRAHNPGDQKRPDSRCRLPSDRLHRACHKNRAKVKEVNNGKNAQRDADGANFSSLNTSA